MFSLVISSVVFLSLYFCSGPYDFFPSTNFGFCLFFLSIVSDLFFSFFFFFNIMETGGSDGKVSACNVGELGSIPGSGRCPGDGNGNPLRYSCLENSMDREAL